MKLYQFYQIWRELIVIKTIRTNENWEKYKKRFRKLAIERIKSGKNWQISWTHLHPYSGAEHAQPWQIYCQPVLTHRCTASSWPVARERVYVRLCILYYHQEKVEAISFRGRRVWAKRVERRIFPRGCKRVYAAP